MACVEAKSPHVEINRTHAGKSLGVHGTVYWCRERGKYPR